MNDYKIYVTMWFAVAMIPIGSACVVIFGAESLNTDAEMAKQGLEQCVKDKGTYNTLWVKDCVRYLKFVEDGIVIPIEFKPKNDLIESKF